MKILFVGFFVFLTCFSGFSQTYQVGHTTINFTDASRNNRIIQTEIYYPANNTGTDVAIASGQFPVVVFGHGFVMVWSAYQNLWDSIVPRGYIMAFPRTEGNISPSHGEFGKDLKFLVSAMQNEGSASSSIFYYGVTDKSAIMGHSMGGGSSILAAANNTSIETVISLAPAETNPSAIAAADSITVDALIMAGAQDGVAPPASHGIPMFDTLGSSCKTFISITGGAHCYFALSNFNCDFGESSSSSGISISRAQQQDVTIDFVSLWLDYKLKGNCNAFSVFNDSLAASPRITHQQTCQANPIPTITNNNGTLQSSAGAGYQWYLNGSIIPGASSQQYSPTVNGNYSVQVIYANGCAETSPAVFFSVVGFEEKSASEKLTVFPNPADEKISILFDRAKGGAVKISVLNCLGQTIKYFSETSDSGKFSMSMDVSDFPAGMYFIITDGDDFHLTNRFSKQ